jgi:hypothetical protein
MTNEEELMSAAIQHAERLAEEGRRKDDPALILKAETLASQVLDMAKLIARRDYLEGKRRQTPLLERAKGHLYTLQKHGAFVWGE